MAGQTKSDGDSALNGERIITEREAAEEWLGIATITLTQMRHRGDSPPYFRCGTRAIRYKLADVLAWREARTVHPKSAHAK